MQVESDRGGAAAKTTIDGMAWREGNLAPSAAEPRTPPGDVRGRHRIRVELSRIQQEKTLLQEESQLLQSAPTASKACKELTDFVATSPDPFLITPSLPQLEPTWNRWFEAPVDSSTCCCWFTH